MIVFADGNTSLSLQTVAGPSWQLFLLPTTFDTATIETLTFDQLCASHIGVVAVSSAALPNKALKFVHVSKSMPNRVCGLPESEPFNAAGPLYRVGINKVSGGTLNDLEKIRLLMDNTESLLRTLAVDAPERVVTYDLNTVATIDRLDFTSNQPYTVECFTTAWVPFVLGTECSKIRITLGSGNVTCFNLAVYTNDASKVVANTDTIGFGVLVPYKVIAGTTPMLLVDVADWQSTGTARINEVVLPAAHGPSLLHLALKPVLLEV